MLKNKIIFGNSRYIHENSRLPQAKIKISHQYYFIIKVSNVMRSGCKLCIISESAKNSERYLQVHCFALSEIMRKFAAKTLTIR